MDSSDDSRAISESSSSYVETEESSEDALEAGKIDFKRDITTIEKLKFQNTIYQAGENIGLRTDPKDQKEIYGKILLIGKAPQANFPLIYVAWYYSKFQGFLTGEAPQYLSDKELVASNHCDWQYIESIVRKIEVLTIEQYENLDYKERENSNIFFMRSYLDFADSIPRPDPRIVCHCLKSYNPDEKLTVCCLCGFQFHAMCARHQYLCLTCQ